VPPLPKEPFEGVEDCCPDDDEDVCHGVPERVVIELEPFLVDTEDEEACSCYSECHGIEEEERIPPRSPEKAPYEQQESADCRNECKEDHRWHYEETEDVADAADN